MILSRSGMVINATPGTGPSSSKISSTSNVQPPVDSLIRNNKGKKKATARKPWADEPWPLIEPLSRTQRITHPAHYIADEVSHTHNAMLRGLNTLYLQAPFVRDPVDVADFLFLAQAWSGWVLEYHEFKESVMIPGFEAVLGLQRGSLGGIEDGFSTRSREEGDINDDMDGNKSEGGVEERGNEDAETKSQSPDLSTHLRNFRSYAIETHSQPSSYSPSTLRTLLTSLASALAPHLHNQIAMLLHMEELSSSPPSNSPFPSMPSLPPLSPSPTPSQPSTLNSISTPPSSTPSALSKSTTSIAATVAAATPPPQPPSRQPPAPPPSSTTPTPTTTSSSSHTTPTRLPRKPATATATPPSPRASSLTQVHLSAESSFSAAVDRYTVPPMAIRLRDAAHDGPGSGSGSGSGGRLSVPAIHAVADRLSPRHAGSWRFLPCDIWGRRRGLEFLGEGEGDGEE